MLLLHVKVTRCAKTHTNVVHGNTFVSAGKGIVVNIVMCTKVRRVVESTCLISLILLEPSSSLNSLYYGGGLNSPYYGGIFRIVLGLKENFGFLK